MVGLANIKVGADLKDAVGLPTKMCWLLEVVVASWLAGVRCALTRNQSCLRPDCDIRSISNAEHLTELRSTYQGVAGSAAARTSLLLLMQQVGVLIAQIASYPWQ